jgi:hypothetical protein
MISFSLHLNLTQPVSCATLETDQQQQQSYFFLCFSYRFSYHFFCLTDFDSDLSRFVQMKSLNSRPPGAVKNEDIRDV